MAKPGVLFSSQRTSSKHYIFILLCIWSAENLNLEPEVGKEIQMQLQNQKQGTANIVCQRKANWAMHKCLFDLSLL